MGQDPSLPISWLVGILLPVLMPLVHVEESVSQPGLKWPSGAHYQRGMELQVGSSSLKEEALEGAIKLQFRVAWSLPTASGGLWGNIPGGSPCDIFYVMSFGDVAQDSGLGA